MGNSSQEDSQEMPDIENQNNGDQNNQGAGENQAQNPEQREENVADERKNEENVAKPEKKEDEENFDFFDDADLSEFSFKSPDKVKDLTVQYGDETLSRLLIPVGKLALYIGRLGRLFYTIGDLFFCVLVLNIVVNYVAILMCSTANFSNGGKFFALLGQFLYVIGFSIPLTMIFWETVRFRWIRCRNPFQTIFDIWFTEIESKETNVKVKKWIGLVTDFISFILIIAFAITYGNYGESPDGFEAMCLIFFFIVPAIKFNIMLLIYFAHSCCALFLENYEFTNKKDPFLISLQRNPLINFCSCYNKENEKKALKVKEYIFFVLKCIGILFGFIYQICIIAGKEGYKAYFLCFILLIISFVFSLTISFPIWTFQIFSRWQCDKESCDCCNEDDILESRQRVGKILKTDPRFFGFKYMNLLVRVLFVGIFLALPFIWAKMNETFTSIKGATSGRWDGTSMSGNYPITSNRGAVRNAMCFTNVHHLNMIQLEALAQMSYFNDIENVKVFMKNSIFRDDVENPVLIDDMEFLTNKDNDGVLLKVDLHVPSSSRNVTVFAVRGSTSHGDWWLDFELLVSSAMFSFARRIPIITRMESSTAAVITRFMTLPIRHLNKITLAHKYTKTLFKAYEDYMYDHKDNNNSILFVGHSLGGSLSKIMGNKYAKQSIAISGPGITPIETLYRPEGEYEKYFKSTFVDVIPDNDLVPRLETNGGVRYRLLCESTNADCHKIGRTVCMTGIICGQENYTGDYCYGLFGREEIEKMKKTATSKI